MESLLLYARNTKKDLPKSGIGLEVVLLIFLLSNLLHLLLSSIQL